MTDPFSRLADLFLTHRRTLRGVVRYTLVARQLEEHLPSPPARVADVGGGAGQQAIPLARKGYEVTILDPSPMMLREARRTLTSEGEDVRRRMSLVQGEGEQAAELLGRESFDAVLCHGVLMYLEDPRPMIQELAAIGRPGALVCVLAKNASTLAMRPALEARCRGRAVGARRRQGSRWSRSRDPRGHSRGVERAVRGGWSRGRAMYGVRVFTDHLGDQDPGTDLPEVLELEWQASRKDPYRSVARLIHLIGQR